jgi:hypothetical protein
VAAGGAGHPAIPPGISGDRHRACRGQGDEAPPGCREIWVR